MSRKSFKSLKILLIILLPLVILFFFCSLSNAESKYSEIIDYRETDVDYEKGLTLKGEKEAKYQWKVTNKSNVTKVEDNYYYFTRNGAKNAKVEIMYPGIRCVYR